jgi:hypothetical protein
MAVVEDSGLRGGGAGITTPPEEEEEGDRPNAAEAEVVVGVGGVVPATATEAGARDRCGGSKSEGLEGGERLLPPPLPPLLLVVLPPLSAGLVWAAEEAEAEAEAALSPATAALRAGPSTAELAVLLGLTSTEAEVDEVL